jgi:hypothetical protein
VLLHHLATRRHRRARLAEGGLDIAAQRVDNYAAGFLRAGASRVLADALSGPAPYVRALFDGRRSLVAAWRGATTAQGNVVSFASERSPGFTAFLDPRTSTGGFYRSLVLRHDVPPGTIAAGGVAPGGEAIRPEIGPSLAALGVRSASDARFAARRGH